MIKRFFNGLLVLAALFISFPTLAEDVHKQPMQTVVVFAPSVAIVQPLPPPPTPEENAYWLALAIYFEGRTDEPEEGLGAIASVILNRTKSPYFPDTIKGVVSHGANGQINGGCQFSFMCDQYPEDIELLCQLRPLDLKKHWGENACQKRWQVYLDFARTYLQNGKDNTGGANMYFAAWMKKKPYWYKELITSSIVRRGSHVFGRNKRFESILALNK
jgi:spore germination cell wall hydrolase CwlJ-like protein